MLTGAAKDLMAVARCCCMEEMEPSSIDAEDTARKATGRPMDLTPCSKAGRLRGFEQRTAGAKRCLVVGGT